jgi:hypothetical protein
MEEYAPIAPHKPAISTGSPGLIAARAIRSPRMSRRKALWTIAGTSLAVGTSVATYDGKLTFLWRGIAVEVGGEIAKRTLWPSPDGTPPPTAPPATPPILPQAPPPSDSVPTQCAPPDVAVLALSAERKSNVGVHVSFTAQRPPVGWHYWVLSKSDAADRWYPSREPHWDGEKTYWADAQINPGSDYRAYVFLINDVARTYISEYNADRVRNGGWEVGLVYEDIPGCRIRKDSKPVPEKPKQTAKRRPTVMPRIPTPGPSPAPMAK